MSPENVISKNLPFRIKFPTSALIKSWKGKDRGFDIWVPMMTMSVLSLRTYARAKAVKVCVPMMGIKAIKMPTAIARAIS
jgi:hypothetical protein